MGMTFYKIKNTIALPNNFVRYNDDGKNAGTIPDEMTVYVMRIEGSSAIISVCSVDESASMPFADNMYIIDTLHKELGPEKGIIEVNNGTTAKGNPYVYDVIKHHRVNTDDALYQFGMDYTLNMNIKMKDEIIFINASFQEEDQTGMRDSMVLAMYYSENNTSIDDVLKNGWFRDPYDDSITDGLLMNYSEQSYFDTMFPNHPLSQLRQFVKYIAENN